MTIYSNNARRIGVLAVSVIAISGASFSAMAQSSTFQVTAAVANACTLTSTALDFGSVDVLATTAAVGTSTVTATCTSGTAYTIGLDAGTNGTDVADRSMLLTGGTALLDYSLSTVAAGGTNWDAVGGTNTAGGTATGLAQDYTVYGQITAGQTDAIAGAYTDSVVATIDF